MKITKKDKATLQEVFRRGMLHIFDTDEEAYRIRAILGRYGILHTLGEYWNWDPDFEGRIAEMWNQEHSFEYVCTVNHCMPMEFVLQHLDVLGSGRNYFHICQRFAGHEGLEVDKSRLAPVDYLALVHHKQIATLSDGEALDLLFEIVHQLCCTISSEVYARSGGELFVTPIDFEPVHRALYYLQELNCPDAIEQFEQWNERVRHDIGASAEHRNTHDDDTPGFSHKDFNIAFKYAYLNLDDRYKKPDDPSVQDILERMRLEFYVRPEVGQPRYSFEPGETIKLVPRDRHAGLLITTKLSRPNETSKGSNFCNSLAPLPFHKRPLKKRP